MKERAPKDVAASARQRLLNLSRQEGRAFNQILQFYAIEGFLRRLAATPWVGSLVVKGATMLRVWNAPLARPTRDIDFLGYLPNDPERVVVIVRDCLAAPGQTDGLHFEQDIAAQPVMVEDRYPGVRVGLRGHLSGATFRLQLDVAVDDVAVPEPGWVTYPTLLEGDGPRILAYAPSTAIAEKLEAIISLGEATSRMKDFYDVWLLATTMDLDGETCAQSVRATFAHRGTGLPSSTPAVLTDDFARRPETDRQWRSFLKKAGVAPQPGLDRVLELLRMFFMPIAQARPEDTFGQHWPRGGPWKPRQDEVASSDSSSTFHQHTL